MTVQARNIHVIVNPVSGNTPAPFQQIGEFLAGIDAKTTLHITKADHTGGDCAKVALDNQADLIIVYGGDGSVMEVANVLHGHDVPMTVLSGGTANVVAHELNIPQNATQALESIFNGETELRQLDAGRINDQHFLLRMSMGWEAELSRRPSAEDKANWGTLAYTRAALEALQDLDPVTYKITLDDDTTHEMNGINCSICNIGNVGLYGISIGLDIFPDDGLLNVLILQNKNVSAMLDMAQNMLASSFQLDIEERLGHYRAKKITVQPSTPQRISYDGEPLDIGFPITVECVPNFVTIIAPKQTTS